MNKKDIEALVEAYKERGNIRQIALAQAAHDLKGQGDALDVVNRAEVYLKFLKGDTA